MKRLMSLLFLLPLLAILSACAPQNHYHNSYYSSVAPPPAPASVYLGCFTDTGSRALPNFLLQSGTTLENCLALARSSGYAFAGLQYGVQCFAGNSVGFTPDVASACNMPCVADPSETCGGVWHNSVYSTGLVVQ